MKRPDVTVRGRSPGWLRWSPAVQVCTGAAGMLLFAALISLLAFALTGLTLALACTVLGVLRESPQPVVSSIPTLTDVFAKANRAG